MGTEFLNGFFCILFCCFHFVKLNDPLMGTELTYQVLDGNY